MIPDLELKTEPRILDPEEIGYSETLDLAEKIDHEFSSDNRPYAPYGVAKSLFFDRSTTITLSGPAGTGKSRACLEKIFFLATKFPESRYLLVRKTRESITESGLQCWEDHVVPVGHPILTGTQRRLRQNYTFPNGSQVMVSGMDKASKILSTEYDVIYCQELIEFEEADLETLLSRLRNGKVPFQQLISDTNPDAPTHWIKQRETLGALRMMDSRHEDNPLFYDHKKGEYTPGGINYLSVLDQLTGPRYSRLRLGQWVQAEGAIYDTYDANVHLIDKFRIPEDWRRLWVVDFGYTHPFVWQAWAIDPDGRMYRYREIYKTNTLVEDHAKRILKITENEPPPIAIICDHDAEDRATLEKHLGRKTKGAKKDVSPGIQHVQTRMKIQGDGKARIHLLRDSLDEMDKRLSRAKKPTCTEQEIPGYVWNTESGKKKGEEPTKEDDHGCLIGNTKILMADGEEMSLYCIRPGMEVMTRKGLRKVLDWKRTKIQTVVVRVEFTHGRHLTGTPDHPLLTYVPSEKKWDWRLLGRVKLGHEVKVPETQDRFHSQNRKISYIPTVVSDQANPVGHYDVYNLTVEDENEYFANGVLVHNCDAMRYGVAYFDFGKKVLKFM